MEVKVDFPKVLITTDSQPFGRLNLLVSGECNPIQLPCIVFEYGIKIDGKAEMSM
jgi:hypothetical protein